MAPRAVMAPGVGVVLETPRWRTDSSALGAVMAPGAMMEPGVSVVLNAGK